MFSKIEGLKLECKGRLALFSFKRKKKVGKVRLFTLSKKLCSTSSGKN